MPLGIDSASESRTDDLIVVLSLRRLVLGLVTNCARGFVLTVK